MYSPHPENSSHTLLRQEAVVLVQGVPLSSYMESLLTSTISSNATKVSEEKIACSTSRTNVHTLIVFLLL